MYCKYCGTEIKEDEKFCGNCGKLAVEENVTVSPKEKVNVENFKGYISEILTVLKNIFKEPVTTTENAPNLLKKQSSFILIGILSVLYGLLNIWAIKAATNASLSLLSAFGNNLDMFGYGNMFGFKMPYGK
ncbi:MAG: zinc ribbon domain-containing protein, partial [Clostridiaceae bacterium]